jgi:dTDP-4-amino-4,6-dideoxygalactose transaminase
MNVTVTPERFAGSFTQQEPIPEAGIAAAVAVMRHGRLHRYGADPSEVSALEAEFAGFTGTRHCLAVASGGYALGCALRAMGVGHGDRVATNAFTLAPVPGAIAAVGAVPVYVGTTPDLTIDMDHLRKVLATGPRALLLSHMRGHVCDMDALMALTRAAGVAVIEDCAHTMGAAWSGVPSGRHGRIACWSTQTYKHMNSGEGGLLTCDDDALMARAVLLSGAYAFTDRHGAAPGPDAFAGLIEATPNVSGRMDEVRAAMLRPQVPLLPARKAAWRARYDAVATGLGEVPGLVLPWRDVREEFVGSSIQFRLPGWSGVAVRGVVDRCAARGVVLKWFGAARPAGYTSTYRDWGYAPSPSLAATDAVLAGLLDMRLPLTFTLDDCALIARIVAAEVRAGSIDRGSAAS